MGLNDKDDELLQQGWRIVEKNQGKIYDLVMDMLCFSKDREPAIEPTDLNELVQRRRRADAAAREGTGRRAGRCGWTTTACRSPADPEGIHRALLNIVSNAMDAVEDGRRRRG